MSLPLSADRPIERGGKYHSVDPSNNRKSGIPGMTADRINRIYQVAVLTFINLKYVFLSD